MLPPVDPFLTHEKIHVTAVIAVLLIRYDMWDNFLSANSKNTYPYKGTHTTGSDIALHLKINVFTDNRSDRLF